MARRGRIAMQDRGGGRTERGVCGRVILDGWRYAVGLPICVRGRSGVIVRIAGTNRRVRSPKVVVHLAVPTGNVRVHQADVDEGEQPRGEPQVLLLLVGPGDPGDSVPTDFGELVPKVRVESRSLRTDIGRAHVCTPGT